jgi:hypothetical protein
LQGYVRFQGVGEIELEAFIFAQFIAMFRQECRWNLKVHQKRNYKLHQIKDEQDCLLKERSGGTK